MITTEQFVLQQAVRANATLSAPRTIDAFEVKLPFDSIIHYMTDTTADLGIRGSNALLQTQTNDVRLSFIQDGYGAYGKPRKITFNSAKFIKGYRQQQKRIRYINDWQRAVSKPKDLVVFDYSLLLRMYQHNVGRRRFLEQWQNIADSMHQKITDRSVSTRNHFIQVKLPEVLPTEAEFRKVEDEIKDNFLTEQWTTPEHFWLREIWKIMKGNPEIFKYAAPVKEKADSAEPVKDIRAITNPERVFFVITEGRTSAIVQMSNLIERGAGQLKKLHDMFEALYKTRTVADDEALEEEEIPDKQIVAGVDNLAIEKIAELGAAGKLTAAQQRGLVSMAQRFDSNKDPFGSGKSVGEMSKITPERIKVKADLPTRVNRRIAPKHATRASSNSLRRDYIQGGVLEADIMNMLRHLSRAGVFVQNMEMEDLLDAKNDARTLKLRIVPANGKASTLPIDLFNFDKDGTFLADGVRYSMDAQKVDVPIRKVGDQRAALTSYYGKLFIQRSPLVKYSYTKWVQTNLNRAAFDPENNAVVNVRFGNNALPKFALPRAYSAAMQIISQFNNRGVVYNFEYDKRADVFGEANVKKYEKNGRVLVAKKGASLYAIDMDDRLIEVTNKNADLGDFMNYLSNDWSKRPVDFAEFSKLKGKNIPLALVFGYYMGLGKLLRRLKVKYRTEPANIRSTAALDDVVIQFSDERLIIKTDDKKAKLILNGFAPVADVCKTFRAADFTRKDVFGPVLKTMGVEKYHLNEFDLIRELFVDPITLEILEDMKEPTDIEGLMERCAELIVYDDKPDETDPEFMRERREERIAGFLYAAMVKGIKEQRNKPNPAIHPIYVGPRDVWGDVVADSTSQLVKELNPAHTLKALEAVSLSGEGGRAAQTLVKSSRVFHPSDVGRYSEATPDSGKVGIRTYTPPDPKIRNLRGMHDSEQEGILGSTQALSTTGLLMPASHHDDPKRQNLCNVQWSAVVPAQGYELVPCRTGYESIIGSRLGDLFVLNMEKSGKVTKVTEDLLQVEYDDGTKQGWELGPFHGKAEGKVVVHHRVTDMKEGEKFVVGDQIAWHRDFFDRDVMSPKVKNVAMKTGALAYTALVENNDTLEDGSRIGRKLQEKLTTTSAKEKGILLLADQAVVNLVKVGQEVSEDDFLCNIMEGSAYGLDQDKDSFAALAKLSGSSPKAKKAGRITSVEITYNGTPENFHPTLRELIEEDEKRRKKVKRDTGRRMATTGQIKRATFVSGEKCIPGTMVITIMIDYDLVHGVGDKGTMANQLKTVHGGTLEGENYSEDGTELDLYFGYRSVNDRIVGGPIKQGVVNTTMIHISKRMYEIYKNGK
jgi:hypothetical protein